MIAELLDRIAHAFRKVSKPRDVTKSVARALDDEWNVLPERRALIRKQDREKRWSELTDKDIEYFYNIFPFLDAEGYHFYFPAFMSYALRRHRDSDSLASDFTIYACTHDCERFALFDAAQMRCVIDFLHFCMENDGYLDGKQAKRAVALLQPSSISPSA